MRDGNVGEEGGEYGSWMIAYCYGGSEWTSTSVGYVDRGRVGKKEFVPGALGSGRVEFSFTLWKTLLVGHF